MNEQMTRLYEAALKIKGIATQSALAKAMHATPQTINNWESRGISKRGMLDAQRFIGCSADWLETGFGSMLVNKSAASGPEKTGGQEVLVHLLANKASMGIGDDELAEDVIGGEIVLTRDFVDRLHPARAESLRFIHAYGDSMAPTLNSGDVLLVDTSVKDVKIDGIYVLKAHERLFVKRVRQRMDGHYEISSDNPTHKTVDVLNGDNQVSVIGRVVFYWNGRKVS